MFWANIDYCKGNYHSAAYSGPQIQVGKDRASEGVAKCGGGGAIAEQSEGMCMPVHDDTLASRLFCIVDVDAFKEAIGLNMQHWCGLGRWTYLSSCEGNEA